MKFYLSSYKVGSESHKLIGLVPKSLSTIGYVPNALDFVGVDLKRRESELESDLSDLRNAGLNVEILDLREYFNGSSLDAKIDTLGGVWVRGGNTFVLRQAMMLSGFDEAIRTRIARDFFYGGYSAGCCVLSPSLAAYQIVDDPKNFPYTECQKTIWEGLGLIDYAFLPHYDSDHFESADIEKELKNCIAKKIPFKAFRDGEVEIFEKCELRGKAGPVDGMHSA